MLLRGLGGKWLGPLGFGVPLCPMGTLWSLLAGLRSRGSPIAALLTVLTALLVLKECVLSLGPWKLQLQVVFFFF